VAASLAMLLAVARADQPDDGTPRPTAQGAAVPATLAGTVNWCTWQVGGANVAVVDGSGRRVGQATTDADGRFILHLQAAPGPYALVSEVDPGESAGCLRRVERPLAILTDGQVQGDPAIQHCPAMEVAIAGSELTWRPVEGAAHYAVAWQPHARSGTAGGGSADTVNALAYRLPDGLVPGDAGDWQVYAFDPLGRVLAFACSGRPGSGGELQPEAPAAAVAPQGGPGLRLNVATYNVNWGCPQPEQAIAAIRFMNADVVCLQETHEEWGRLIRRRLSRLYPHMVFHSDGRTAAGGMAFLSKWPMQSFALVPSATGWFDAWIVLVRTPAGPVQFLGVHTQPCVGDDWTIGVKEYVVALARHLAEVRRFHAELRDGYPTVVLGDFNEGPAGAAMQWLAGEGLANCVEERGEGGTTWRWDVGAIRLTGWYDHILHTADLRCTEARIIRMGASDHWPVAASLALEK
jgi:endonuclease/exonuclease/phosphatase (EEP) superfamily protein YafD